MFSEELERFPIERRGRVNGQERTESNGKILFGLGERHRRRKTAQGNAEEFLHDLKADGSLPGFDGLLDKPASDDLFWGNALAQRVDKYVGIEKDSIAHSSRRACRGPQNRCA